MRKTVHEQNRKFNRYIFLKIDIIKKRKKYQTKIMELKNTMN